MEQYEEVADIGARVSKEALAKLAVRTGGDVIVAMDGQPVTGFEDLRGLLLDAKPGQEVTFTLLRDGNEISVDVALGERPATTP